MRARAVVTLQFPSQKSLDTVFQALMPEAKKPLTRRSAATLTRKGGSLVLRVEARDTVALRATLNAYLRWINSVKDVLDVLDKRQLLSLRSEER